MCGILFGLLYRLLCTGTRGQNQNSCLSHHLRLEIVFTVFAPAFDNVNKH